MLLSYLLFSTMAWRSIQARLGVIQGSRYHPCFNIKSDGNTKGVVFFMHGLGDMGMGWAQLFAMQAHSNVRYVFPSANHMPVTLNMGMDMPSWFDIKNLSHDDNDRYDKGLSRKSHGRLIKDKSTFSWIK